MKLLRLIRTLNPTGGGPIEGVCQITPHLTNLGVDTTVASLDPPNSHWFSTLPFKAIGLGPVIGNYGYRPNLKSAISGLAKQHDAVIIEGIWQYHSFVAWRALKNCEIPYFIYPHGMLDPWFERTYPLKHIKKCLYWPWADYRVLRDATAVLFTTEQERSLARQSFWLYRAKEYVVGYGTSAPPGSSSLQRSEFTSLFPSLRGKRILLYLSRIHPKKGLDLLIEAFALVSSSDPRLHLVIAGPDQVGWQRELEQRICILGLDKHVTWTGMLTGDVKWGALHSAELLCLPSHQENFGVVVAEALACGLPVAIAEPVNISTEVAAAGAGMVHADTVAGTTEALRRWLVLGESEKEQMKQRAVQLFAERFDFASVARNMMPLLLQQKPHETHAL